METTALVRLEPLKLLQPASVPQRNVREASALLAQRKELRAGTLMDAFMSWWFAVLSLLTGFFAGAAWLNGGGWIFRLLLPIGSAGFMSVCLKSARSGRSNAALLEAIDSETLPPVQERARLESAVRDAVTSWNGMADVWNDRLDLAQRSGVDADTWRLLAVTRANLSLRAEGIRSAVRTLLAHEPSPTVRALPPPEDGWSPTETVSLNAADP